MTQTTPQNLDDHTPMMQQYLNIKSGYPNALVLYRMGDFYELFFDDAKLAHQILGITLTKRGKDKQGNDIAMAGVPFHSADSYIARLIGAGQTVVICEQVAENDENHLSNNQSSNNTTVYYDKSAKTSKNAPKIMARKVVRTLTAGTLTDDSLIHQGQIPTVIAISFAKQKMSVGIAELNLAQGSLRTCELDCDNLEQLKAELIQALIRFDPSEILIDEQLSDAWRHCLQDCCPTPLPIVSQAHSLFLTDNANAHLYQHLQVSTLAGFGLSDKQLATACCSVVLHYGKQTQQASLSHIRQISLEHGDEFLQLDSISQQNLEIFKPVLSSGISLLSVIDRCQTPMGKRALIHHLHRPLLNTGLIHRRLDAVQQLKNLPEATFVTLCEILHDIGDIERIGGRIGLLSARPNDCVKLRESLDKSLQLSQHLQQVFDFHLNETQITSDTPLLAMLTKQLPNIEKNDIFWQISQQLQHAIVDEPPSHTRDGGMIKQGYHAELDRLRTLHNNVEQTLENLANDERLAHNLPTLKVGFNKVSGFYFELSSLQAKNAPPHFSRRQTLKNAERYITPALKAVEESYLSAQSQAIALEKQLYHELLTDLQQQLPQLQQLAKAVAYLDVLANWVTLTRQYAGDWCRPSFYQKNKDKSNAYIHIEQGRHLVVEAGQSQSSTQKTIHNKNKTPFIANDCQLATDEQPETLMLITGPNMGGKSTYMRQTALILLMACCGAYVPAKVADFGLIKRIFTRIGSADDLASGKSTFMVEMIETANIMNQACANSLVLMDEVGRGTSTQDGLAIAHACVNYLAEKIGCLTLFATHYFELTELAEQHPKMLNQHLVTQEIDGQLLLLHKIAKGATHRSFGLHVAKMAGLPTEILQNAQQFLHQTEFNTNLNQSTPHTQKVVKNKQADLFDNPMDSPEPNYPDNNRPEKQDQTLHHPKIYQQLSSIDADDLTPKQALALIYSLKELLNDTESGKISR